MSTIHVGRVTSHESGVTADAPHSRIRMFPQSRELRVVLVHDWLITLGGADRVLLALHQVFPQAPAFVSLFDPSRLPEVFREMEVYASWLQRVPGAVRRHRLLVPLMPFAFASFDLPHADVVLSSSHACAKGVRVPPGAVHICYCHTPMRYAWDLSAEYLQAVPVPARPLARAALGWLRRWDRATATSVDYFVANSRFVADRIRRHYQREAVVIYPPVDVDYFTPGGWPEEYFLVVSRLVPYKRVDLAVEAFNRVKRPLVVVGDGPELPRLRAMAGPAVTFAGEVGDETLRDLYRGCQALIFPGEEDFGIVPVEAQACARPVIAYGHGGALESVRPGVTGLFFGEETTESLAATVRGFEREAFDPALIRAHAEQFSRQRFARQIAEFVAEVVARRQEAVP